MRLDTLIQMLCMAALVLTTAPLMACGGDKPPARRSTKKKKKKKKKKKAALGKEAIDESKIPAKLRNVDWKKVDAEAIDLQKGVRDPFKPHVEDLLKARQEDPAAGGGDLDVKIPEPVGGLELIAIITGTAVHKAMVVDKEGVGHIVRAGEIIGKPPMRVARITRNEVLFKGLTPPETPDEKEEEVRKVLLTQAELEELLP